MSTKQRILELLEGGGGESISGAELARLLGLSRTAVWKAVGALKKDGYPIDATTNRGYRLLPQAEKLSRQALLPWLPAGFPPERLRLYGSLASTNLTAKELALAGAEHGTVVISDTQTAGRGRRGHGFHSPPGGIYVSFVLRPRTLPLSDAALVTVAASVAVCRAVLEVTKQQAQIKWVNDIYLEGKKICGILTEAEADMESGLVERIILGLGLNFNAEPACFPPELREKAGALCPGSDDGALKARLTAALIRLVLELEERPRGEALLAEYRRRSLLLGKPVTVRQSGAAFSATAVDIDDMGRLVVRMEDGAQVALRAGEVSVDTDC